MTTMIEDPVTIADLLPDLDGHYQCGRVDEMRAKQGKRYCPSCKVLILDNTLRICPECGGMLPPPFPEPGK